MTVAFSIPVHLLIGLSLALLMGGGIFVIIAGIIGGTLPDYERIFAGKFGKVYLWFHQLDNWWMWGLFLIGYLLYIFTGNGIFLVFGLAERLHVLMDYPIHLHEYPWGWKDNIKIFKWELSTRWLDGALTSAMVLIIIKGW